MIILNLLPNKIFKKITFLKMNEILRFKNIKFFNCNFKYIYSRLIYGGYLVAPAASSLVTIFKKKITIFH